MDLGIKGRTALVLAAGGGLGSAIAVALAREGARTAIADIDAVSLEATARAVAAVGSEPLPVVWDLGDLAGADAKVKQIEGRLGSVDILVNLTGGPPPSGASAIEPETWQSHFEKMVLSVVKITDRVLPAMRERRWGRIITSTSSGVVAPIPGLAISNSLRLSLVGWSKSLSREEAPFGITANVVVPGRIDTGRVRSLDAAKAKRGGRAVEDVMAESVASIPVGRYGRPQEYAAAVAFLASDAASYITGTMLRVDGGLVPTVY
jgi:3-oxoacyl-[acyl-carrier protein] reductase